MCHFLAILKSSFHIITMVSLTSTNRLMKILIKNLKSDHKIDIYAPCKTICKIYPTKDLFRERRGEGGSLVLLLFVCKVEMPPYNNHGIEHSTSSILHGHRKI